MQNRKISQPTPTPPTQIEHTGIFHPRHSQTSNFNFAAIPVKSEKPSGNQKISTRVGTPLLARTIPQRYFVTVAQLSTLPRSSMHRSSTWCSKWDWRIIIKRRQNSEFISARYLIDVAVERGVRGPAAPREANGPHRYYKRHKFLWIQYHACNSLSF